jgi:D-sedoheptulose 7-phosphate isomerase
MTSPIQTTFNNLDRLYTGDPAAFAGRYLSYLQTVLQAIDTEQIGRFIKTLLDARDRGSTVFFIGNGGSAATASHFANDIAIGTNDYEKPFRAISLTDNVAVLTAIANDFGYEEVFVRQLRVLARAGDVLVGISASGNSPNLVRALEYCKSVAVRTIAITAFDGGRMKQIADDHVHVATGPKEYGPAEDAHMIIDHLVGAYLVRRVQRARG